MGTSLQHWVQNKISEAQSMLVFGAFSLKYLVSGNWPVKIYGMFNFWNFKSTPSLKESAITHKYERCLKTITIFLSLGKFRESRYVFTFLDWYTGKCVLDLEVTFKIHALWTPIHALWALLTSCKEYCTCYTWTGKYSLFLI